MYDIEIISAPSILGLKPTGVEELPESLLNSGLSKRIKSAHPVVHLPTLNVFYTDKRDEASKCLNPQLIRFFSLLLGKAVTRSADRNRFPFVLGGDCSILIGIMSALKQKGNYGLIFLDAHADFYEPDKSLTGEVADMDLAITTGRGPEILTNIKNLQPYVKDENVIHIGQRDWEETKKYGAMDIRETAIKCYSHAYFKKTGINTTIAEVLKDINESEVEEFWIHFDTDVLSDDVNPAVDYRLPDGFIFKEIENLLRNLLSTLKISGISITIFNPRLDKTGQISEKITRSLGRAFR